MNSFKKIAIVIAAALTGSALVALPSQAAPTVAYTTLYDTTNGVQVIGGFATLTINTDTNTVATVTLSGVGSIVSASAGSNTTLLTPVNGYYQITTSNVGAGVSTLIISSPVAGASTVTVTPITAGTGIPGTPVVKTVTWTSSGTLAVSPSYTTVYSAVGVAAPDATTNAVAIVAPKAVQSAAANAIANILVAPKDGNNNAITNGTLTVTVAGPGMIGLGTTQANAVLQGRAVTGTAGQYFVNVFGDGTSGTSTITISSGSTVLATKTIIFAGDAATYTATKGFSVYRVGSNGTDGSSTSYGVAVAVKDANNNPVSNGTTVYATSASTSVATVSASTTTTGGVAYFAINGVATGDVAITFANATTTPTVSTSTVVTIGSSVASSVTLSFDKKSYINGEKVQLTLKAVDASGKPISDIAASGASYTDLLSADLISSTQLGGSTLVGSKTPTFVGGVATWNLYAPLSAGPFTVTGTTGTAAGLALSAQKVALSTTANVLDANATANAALLAQLDALNAKIVALNALIAKIMKKLKIK
jgi:hypothetical protein